MMSSAAAGSLPFTLGCPPPPNTPTPRSAQDAFPSALAVLKTIPMAWRGSSEHMQRTQELAKLLHKRCVGRGGRTRRHALGGLHPPPPTHA